MIALKRNDSVIGRQVGGLRRGFEAGLRLEDRLGARMPA